LLDFCQSTYEAAAITGKWDRANLERQGIDCIEGSRGLVSL